MRAKSFPRYELLTVTSLAALAGGLCLAGPVKGQEATAPGGPAPGPAFTRSFSGQISGTAAHRDEVRLDVGGASGQTMRMTLDLQWLLATPRTALRASLGPYFEMFSDADLSTYGGAAGFGMERVSSPMVSWNVRATLLAAPEQDVATPQVEAEPGVPRFRVFVPRNGFVAFDAGGGLTRELSTRSSLAVTALVSRRKYNAFDTESGAQQPANLADQDSVGLSTGYSRQLTAARSWSLGASARRISLSGGRSQPRDRKDTRDQLGVTAGTSQRFGAQALSVEGGFSWIDTGQGGTAGSVVFDGTWAWAGRRAGTSVALRRAQGVFASERAATTGTSVVSVVNWKWLRRSNVSVSGEYGLSERASGGSGDVRTRGLAASYAWQGRLLGWGFSVSSGRQRSDADFGRDQDTTTVSLSLSWRFAGAGRHA